MSTLQRPAGRPRIIDALREEELRRLSASGWTISRIAAEMNLPESTVGRYLQDIGLSRSHAQRAADRFQTSLGATRISIRIAKSRGGWAGEISTVDTASAKTPPTTIRAGSLISLIEEIARWAHECRIGSSLPPNPDHALQGRGPVHVFREPKFGRAIEPE